MVKRAIFHALDIVRSIRSEGHHKANRQRSAEKE
jgi:hypothetical protein